MKKSVLALISCTFLLAGCGRASATIQNGGDVLMTVGNTTITREDEYICDKNANGGQMVLDLVKQSVYNKVVGVDDAMKKDAEASYDDLKNQYEGLEDQLSSLGYKGKDDYINRVLIPNAQAEALQEQYFQDNKENIQKEYKPSVAKIIQCNDEKTAKKAIKALKDGTDEQEVYDTYQSSYSTYTNADTVITTENELPTRLINTLYEAEKPGLIDEAFTDDDDEDDIDNQYYYVAILVDNDYDSILDQIKGTIKSMSSSFSDDCIIYYLKKYDFKVYDQDIFDYYKTNNPKYLVSHPELAE